MRAEDWPSIERLLLGWPSPASRPLDAGGYRALLRDFDAAQVAEALRGMVGAVRHRPTPSEIGAHIRAAAPGAATSETWRVLVAGRRLVVTAESHDQAVAKLEAWCAERRIDTAGAEFASFGAVA